MNLISSETKRTKSHDRIFLCLWTGRFLWWPVIICFAGFIYSFQDLHFFPSSKRHKPLAKWHFCLCWDLCSLLRIRPPRVRFLWATFFLYFFIIMQDRFTRVISGNSDSTSVNNIPRAPSFWVSPYETLNCFLCWTISFISQQEGRRRDNKVSNKSFNYALTFTDFFSSFCPSSKGSLFVLHPRNWHFPPFASNRNIERSKKKAKTRSWLQIRTAHIAA